MKYNTFNDAIMQSRRMIDDENATDKVIVIALVSLLSLIHI